ncbi:dynactin p62 [Eremomyces bilateralis CBS 781.70]|uniref:Dynactin subunit 4 n=1 Tax=Eremomyces bilateralis CBS 781.70 TaxID=1392243 RepID=A0A6G1GDZ7_9PEZI|nr:dynactin p62 [Eremomyces bilateralis CBS 781.70]KAF1816111.1 dynactin p62 [Eremomyces bilateralis CBS 781.70]
MSVSFPYTYYACSCADNTSTQEKRVSQEPQSAQDEDERTFDPRSRRSNFSLYPIEHLLYCTECHEMRCPRCVTEEVICWYCPNCLFEAPSSTIKQEGHRCSRNCFNCPICTSPLSVNSLEQPDPPPDDKPANKFGGPYILHCPYCAWSTLDIGITFPRPSNITGQLAKTLNGGLPRPPRDRKPSSSLKRSDPPTTHHLDDLPSPTSDTSTSSSPEPPSARTPDPQDRYHHLLAFYKHQLSTSDAALLPGTTSTSASELGPGSPSSIARLLHMYGSSIRSRAPESGPSPMREAATPEEGLLIYDAAAEAADDATIRAMQTTAWDTHASVSQRLDATNRHARAVDDLRPISPLLRTKRAKRCGACRQILAKPEGKVTSVRSKIKLLALQNLPKLSIKPLASPSTMPPPGTSAAGRPTSTLLTTFSSPTLALPALSPSSPFALRPLTTTHYLLTLTNPLYDSIRVHLAAPSALRGRHGAGSRVTILCPQFEVGANTDRRKKGERERVEKVRREEAFWTVLGVGRIVGL